MKIRGRLSRRLLIALLGVLLIGSNLPAGAQSVEQPLDEAPLFDGIDVSEIPVEGVPVFAEPISDEDRIPLPVPADMNGLSDPEFVELHAGDGATLEQIVGDEIPVPTDGGSDFNAYSPEPDVGTHFLVLFPEIVNEREADGDWGRTPRRDHAHRRRVGDRGQDLHRVVPVRARA